MSSTSRSTIPRFSRVSSEPESQQQRSSRHSLADNERTLLERNWSTSGRDPQQQNNAASSEFTLGASWSSGFGGGDDDEVAAFAQSWSSGFGDAPIGQAIPATSSVPPAVSIQNGSELPGSRRNSQTATTTQADLSEGGVTSAIHDAARIKDYTRVKELSLSHPEDAQFVGQGGWTALHHLCDRRCPEADVVEACIKACPEALVKPENKGWTPLHHACRNKAPADVVSLLLHLYPQKGKYSASKPDRQGRSPLWYAVRYDAPKGVVPSLLEVDPSVVLSDDQHSESPLALVWDSWAEKLDGTRTLRPYVHPEQTDGPVSAEALKRRLHRQEDLLKRWKRSNMFLKAAFGFPLQEDEELTHAGDRKWRILHATAAVKCHPTLFQMACALHPEQAEELDNNDLYGQRDGSNNGSNNNERPQTALHLATSSNATGAASQAVISSLLRLFPNAAQMRDGIDGSLPLHRIVENKDKQHWTFDGVNPLYMIYPRAVELPDNNGKLPLHRAAAAISPRESTEDLPTRSIICNLIHVHPEAAGVADAAGCLPLHLIAKHAETWNAEVGAVFEAHQAAMRARTGPGYNNSLPIHLAAANPDARRSLIERLVELNPRGVSQSDRRGKLPLHLACEQGKDWDEGGLDIIYDAFPQAVRDREDNERHWMALHMASASRTASGGLIIRLVELNREACDVADSQGRFPLHLACESGKNWLGGLEALFEGNPLAISSGDSQGRLPFYIAALRIASTAAEEAVCRDADIEGENVESLEGIMAEKAQRAADELDILFNLLRSDPTILPHSI